MFSCVINILMLTGPLFMLQIYDRVLTSRSVSTLAALFVLVVGLYFFMGVLDLVRSRVLTRVGHRLDGALGRDAFLAAIGATAARPGAGKSDPVRDVDQLRNFLSSNGVTALFDMPWLPIYVAIVFAINIWLGLLAAAGAVVLFIIALWTDQVARPLLRQSGGLSVERNNIVTAGARNSEAVVGMGMQKALGSVWDRTNDKFLAANAKAADTVGLSSVVSKVFRLFLQSAVLALGAYLAIYEIISPGAMIAASIIMARGLQPVESAVQNWRQMLAAQQAYRRLREAASRPQPPTLLDLPAPHRAVQVDNLSVVPPGSPTPTLLDVRFTARAGAAVGIIGPSGSGKSTLARALVGVWPAARGAVLLDGAPLAQWSEDLRSDHIGYLPQDVELFAGTVAENISRFRSDATDESIIQAAQNAGCHELVLSFKDGYSTVIGDGGRSLSAGQRQRIALARALYGDPFLIVLDEPNSNLDGYGDSALTRAISLSKARGAVVIVVAHRPSALSATDTLCLFENGRLVDHGPRDDVLQKVMRREKVSNVRPAAQISGNATAQQGATATASAGSAAATATARQGEAPAASADAGDKPPAATAAAREDQGDKANA
ncbi:MAG: type I secretion system permease/ATPase [Acuticoccus sp.]